MDEWGTMMTHMADLRAERDAAITRAEAAEADSAALRAQLTGQGWHLVGEYIPIETTIELKLPVKVSADDNALYYHADHGGFIGYLKPGGKWRANLEWRPAPPKDEE